MAVLCCFGATAPHLSAVPGVINRVHNPAPNAYIIELEADTPATSNAETLSHRAGAKLGFVYDTVMNGFSIRGTEQQAIALTRMPGVASVTEVRKLQRAAVQYSPSKGLDRIDQRTLPLSGSYTYTIYTAPTNVYIVDTGVNPHPDFGNRLVTNVNFARTSSGVVDPNDYTENGLPLNDVFHGTASAVVAAGTQYGIARWAKIHNVRVCDFGACWDDSIIAGVNFVQQKRNAAPSEVHVANASFVGAGGPSNSDNAIFNSVNQGMAWILSAGNVHEDACGFYPASMAATRSGAMSVGAANPSTDAVEPFSNQGPCVEIFAPGRTLWGHPLGATREATGTSISAPFVTGVFAVRWANSPTSSAAEIEGVIKGVGTGGVLTNIWANSPNLLLYSVLPRRPAVGH